MTSNEVDRHRFIFGKETHIGETTERSTESRYRNSDRRYSRFLVATQTATCDRELKPSLSQMFLTWLSAVRSDR